MAARKLTGVLLVGGASRRFGSPKALARLGEETLAERVWRILGEACDERLALGKAKDALELPFPVLDDGNEVRAPLAGVVAGLRAATNDVCVFCPVDVPRITPAALRKLGEACAEAAVPDAGPLPGAYSKRALPLLERCLASGRLALKDALRELDVRLVELDAELLLDVDTEADLRRLYAASFSTRTSAL